VGGIYYINTYMRRISKINLPKENNDLKRRGRGDDNGRREENRRDQEYVKKGLWGNGLILKF
jgi:hypothetical protein